MNISYDMHTRMKQKGTEYLVKWSGYPLSESSWVPVEDLNLPFSKCSSDSNTYYTL